MKVSGYEICVVSPSWTDGDYSCYVSIEAHDKRKGTYSMFLVESKLLSIINVTDSPLKNKGESVTLIISQHDL